MSSPILLKRIRIEYRKCCICKRKFSLSDHLMKGTLDQTKIALMNTICPDCLKRLKEDPLLSEKVFEKVIFKPETTVTKFKTDFPAKFEKDISEPKIHRTSYRPEPTVSKISSISNLLFWILVVISISCGFYSAASKFLRLNLPSFPFYGYIMGHVILSLIIHPRKIAPALLFLVSLNFLSATFRNTFFSQFGSTTWMVIIMVVFIVSNYTEVIVILAGVVQLFKNKFYLILPCVFVIYFGLVSPFYFGIIKPGPYGTERKANPEPYTIDKVYRWKIPAEDIAPHEAARRYFVEGKEYAAKGNRTGFIKSIQLYERALELMPNFSSAYAEMAYSYASIAKIQEESRKSEAEIRDNYRKAKKAIVQAKKLNPENPHVWGIDAILHYYMKNRDKAKNSLLQAKKLAKNLGYTDRVLQAMALVTKKKIDSVSYLLAIKEIRSDNAESQYNINYRNHAELHNLLGVAYYSIGNKELAKKMFERAKRLSPNFGKPYLNLALVYEKKEAPRMYKEALTKDKDLKYVASYYFNVLRAQKWLKRFYILLVLIFIFRYVGILKRHVKIRTGTGIAQFSPKGREEVKKLLLNIALVFIATYGPFEIYIHFIRPINGIDYMFPIGFPFF